MNSETCFILQQRQEKSDYKDQIGEQYHYPNRKGLKCLNDGGLFIYYDPDRQEYFGSGRIGAISPDPADSAHSFARLHDYQAFPLKVPKRDVDGKNRETGPHYNPQNSIRRTTPQLFDTIRQTGGLSPLFSPAGYSADNAAQELFMERIELDHLLALLRRKKNLVLQGPPGVGKTFAACRLAWALIGRRETDALQMVQFHPSYSYEDFIQGLRPAADGRFRLRDGVFVDFCRKAVAAPDSPHVFIIDEINRGQLAKIFGELMLLIEPSKRGASHGVPLMYSSVGDPLFFVPSNVHFIGTMNTADRSLSLVDYALRRRFAFATLKPALESPAFERDLLAKGRPRALIERIRGRMAALNKIIEDDSRSLGAGYQIGHSFFCGEGGDPEQWYDDVIKYEVLPLIEEYWIDQPKKLAQAREAIGLS